MAELNMPTISMRIEADGTTAIQEIEKTADATDKIREATEKLNEAEKKYHVNSAGRWVDANGRFVKASEVIADIGEETAALIKNNSAASKKAAELADNTKKVADEAGEVDKKTKTAAQRFKELGARISEISRKAMPGLINASVELNRIGAQMTKFTTAPIVGALTAAVKVAGDFSETLSKTEVVFGGMTDAVLDWSEKSIDAMGLAQSTALEMASTYGDMATGMGLAGFAAADMSMNMTQLAADIASFKNKSISEVNTALTGIFTGETESLKQLGIIMTQTNLQAFALEQGITKSLSAMSQAEQVQLRYAYVMAQSSNAQGDFARTGDSLNNQTRKLTETIKQLAKEFGGPLTDKVASVAGSLQQAAQWLSELDEGTKNTILNIGLMVAAAGPLLMIGGKLLTMITGLKTQLALLAANPITLIVGGGIAAIAALIAVANNAGKGLEETSKTYQRLKNAVEGGASGEITIDDSQVQELAENPPTITINADGQNALNEAQSIADKLNGDEYDGTLSIDGDPDKAEEALTELERAIEAAEAAMTIDADGNAVLEPGGELERLKKAIAAVEGMVVITTDPAKKAELQGYLDDLKAQLAAFNINVSYTEDPETKANIDAFAAKLATLPKDETYSATGEFKISEATPETIQQYAEALAAAATATGDYAEAVNNLNNIVDQETQRAIAEVNAGIAEEARKQAALLNAGYTTEEEYNANMASTFAAAEERIRQIEAEAEAQKELNQTYADGIKTNDYSTASGALLEINADAQLSEAEIAEYARYAKEAAKNGEQSTKAQFAAEVALGEIRKEAIADRNELTMAVEKYDFALASANKNEQTTITNAQEESERLDVMIEALSDYNSKLSSGAFSPAEAAKVVLGDYAEELSAYSGLADELRTLFQGENGEGMGFQESLEALVSAQTLQEKTKEQIIAAGESAKAARETATQELEATVAATKEGFDAIDAAAMIDIAEQVGLTVSEADKALVDGINQMIANATEAAENGTEIGKNLTAGVAQGIASGTPTATAAARASARAVTAAYKAELDINSPSRVGRDEIGIQIPRGIGEGIELGMPEVLATIKRSTEGIITGATAVVNKGVYSIQTGAVQAPAAAGIDYERLADAVSKRPIAFSVGARELAVSTRDETARQQAVRVQQINRSYGNGG